MKQEASVKPGLHGLQTNKAFPLYTQELGNGQQVKMCYLYHMIGQYHRMRKKMMKD